MFAMQDREDKKGGAGAFKAGGICLAFLVMGYQAAVFVHKAAVLHIAGIRDKPDTVYVVDERLAARLLQTEATAGGLPEGSGAGDRDAEDMRGQWPGARKTPVAGGAVVRKNAARAPAAEAVRMNRRRVESFRFNPNTASVEELQRLGFSEKQALSIDAYRQKGGRFRRKSDFARSYVVSDSVYRRLEKYIDIPKVDINKADSAAFDALPGIGPWFAARMVAYRKELGGYSCPEQLMDIYRFDAARYEALKDLICCSEPRPFRLWSLPADSLRRHPYIRSWPAARAIVLYREHTPAEERSVGALARAGILPDSLALKLSRCRIE